MMINFNVNKAKDYLKQLKARAIEELKGEEMKTDVNVKGELYVALPFKMCEDCKFMKITPLQHYSEIEGIVFTQYLCENTELCNYVISKYEKELNDQTL